MARRDDINASVGKLLRKGVTVLASARTTRRSNAMWSALFGGGGAAVGYLIADLVSGGVLAAAIGGGMGASLGVIASSAVTSIRMRRSYGIPAAVVLLVLTNRRLLMLRLSWLDNRAVRLIREMGLRDITSIVVGDARVIAPHPVTITPVGASPIELEAGKVERPQRIAEAFRRATGR
jgi:hypothetical protein